MDVKQYKRFCNSEPKFHRASLVNDATPDTSNEHKTKSRLHHRTSIRPPYQFRSRSTDMPS